MVSRRNFKVALLSSSALLKKKITPEAYLKREDNLFGRLLYLLAQAMHFSFQVSFSNSGGIRLQNGTWTGLIGMLNRSEADIAAVAFFITEQRKEAVTFSYPFFIEDVTFMTRNPEYSPEIFAMFYTFTNYVWMTLGVFVITMILLYFTLMRYKRSFANATFRVLAVCLNQPISLKLMAAGEKLLLLSWMVGMAFLSMGYKSVLLSFLTFPPLSGVSTVSELARAVEAGEYNCMINEGNSLPSSFSNSSERKLKVIGDNILQSAKGEGTVEDFFDIKHSKIAYIETRDNVIFAQGRYFISKDSFIQTFGAMAVRRDFCCKQQLDMAIHRINAAGLYQKLVSDKDYRLAYKAFSPVTTQKDPKRKLTVTDISSALMFLICGYCVSFVVLIAEMLSGSTEKCRPSAIKKRKKNKHTHTR